MVADPPRLKISNGEVSSVDGGGDDAAHDIIDVGVIPGGAAVAVLLDGFSGTDGGGEF